MQALEGEGVCFAHSPERARERTESRSRGGRSRAKQVAALSKPAGPMLVGFEAELTELRPSWWRLVTTADTARGLAHIAQEVMTGRIEPRQANAAVAALNALVHALRGEPATSDETTLVDAKDALDDILDALAKRDSSAGATDRE
jgi:hypothetical protein